MNLGKFSEKNKLNVRTPASLDTKVEIEYFKSLSPYIVIVAAYGNLIPKDYLNDLSTTLCRGGKKGTLHL